MRRAGNTGAAGAWWTLLQARSARPASGAARPGAAGGRGSAPYMPLLVESLRQAGARAQREASPVVIVVRLGPGGGVVGAEVVRAGEPGAAAVLRLVEGALMGPGGARS